MRHLFQIVGSFTFTFHKVV